MRKLLWLTACLLIFSAIPARAQVTSLNTSVSYTCSGSTGPYSFGFPISDATALSVIQNGATLLTTSYTVAPVNNQFENGGSVTLNTACPSPQTLVLARITPLTQLSIFTNNMPTPYKTFQYGLDKLTEIDQEIAQELASILAYQAALVAALATSGITPYPEFTYSHASGMLSVPGIDKIVYVDGVIYTTVQAAINALPVSGGTVIVPPGTYSGNTTINLASNVILQGAGLGSTAISYTGAGNAISLSGLSASGVTGLTVSLSNSSATGIKIASSSLTQISDVRITGTSAKLIYITGDGASSYSTNTKINRVRLDTFANGGIFIDHALDTFLTDISSYGNANNVTSRSLVLDTGTSGLYVKSFASGYGLHGLHVQNTNSGGSYGTFPIYLFFDQFLGDTSTGGDGWLFDSTLGTAEVSAYFTDSWSAASGLNDSGSIVTAASNGVHISGGLDINIQSSRIRDNSGNGILLDSTNVTQVIIGNNHIYANNLDDNGDQHGVYVSVAASKISINNNRINNSLDGEGGHQRYGVKFNASASEVQLVGNDLGTNITGGALFPTLANYVSWGNLPSITAVPNQVYGSSFFQGLIQVNGPMCFNGATSGQACVQATPIAGSPCTLEPPTTNPTAGQAITSAAPSGGLCQLSWGSVGGGGLSGMTATQVPIAATASTVTSSKAIQGTDTNLLSSGTVSGTSVLLCSDANGGATTSGCPPGGTTTGQSAKGLSYNTSGTATTVDASIVAPTTQGQYGCGYTLPTAVAVNPACSLVGLVPDAAAGASILFSDNNNEIDAPAAALAIPVPTTSVAMGGLGNANFYTVIVNDQATASVLTPAGSWMISRNGATAASTASVDPHTKCALRVDQVTSTQWDLSCGPTTLYKVEYCGATSGSTQACAKTLQTIPIFVFGDATLNTATTQAITTLPFTSSSTYACSGSDLTTPAGVVSFSAYTSGAQATIQETGGANTDHLRYQCIGY